MGRRALGPLQQESEHPELAMENLQAVLQWSVESRAGETIATSVVPLTTELPVELLL